MHLKTESYNRLHAYFCAAFLLLCALLTKPYVEMGISDDFGYVRSAQLLAQTGHIHYNGSTPMLVWQLYLGALFIKLFGFSFTVVRSSILMVSVVTAYLLHRVMTKFGLHAWNATLGTLTVMLSPVWLMLTVTFMTDATGLFCLILCLYACQRAVLTENGAAALRWLCIAGLTDIAGGMVRQIAWVGILVIVPSTAWLLRRRQGMLACGIVLWVSGIAAILASLHWFQQQPYAEPEKLLKGAFDQATLTVLLNTTIQGIISFPLLSLPAMMLFLAGLRDLERPRRYACIGGIGIVVAGLIVLLRAIALKGLFPRQFLPPWIGDNLTISGVMQAYEIIGRSPIVLRERAQVALGLTMVIAVFCAIAHIALAKRPTKSQKLEGAQYLSWNQTKFLLLPGAMAYLALLVPRAAGGEVFDRYLIPPMVVLLVFLLRYVQERVSRPSYRLSALTLLLFSAYAVAGTHDLFSFDRARLQAAAEVTQAGVPRTALEGGFEYDGWTQIVTEGYMDDPRMLNGAYHLSRIGEFPCHEFAIKLMSAVKPKFVLSFDPETCYRPSSFPPVPYHAWLPPRNRAVYIQQITPWP